MKKDNKKALYESIMTSVAKEVKKALNEKRYYGEDVEYAAIEFHGDWHIYHYNSIDEVVNQYGIEEPEYLQKLERLQNWESLHIVWGEVGFGAEDVVIIKVG